MLQIEQFPAGKWKTNCFVISDAAKNTIIVDPGNDFVKIFNYISNNNLIPLAILNTHSHHDHIGAVCDLQEVFNVPFYLHAKDKVILSRAKFFSVVLDKNKDIKIPIFDKDLEVTPFLNFGSIEVQVIHSPGHTPGSVCFLIGNRLFSGDTLLYNTDALKGLPGDGLEELKASVNLLFELPKELMVYPGHGKITPYDDSFRRKIMSIL